MACNFIRFFITDTECKYENVSYPGIPIFFSEKGIIPHVSEYMIYLRKTDSKPPSTVETYAYQIQKFLKYIRKNDIHWGEVNDQILLSWRDSILSQGCLVSTVNHGLSAVFNFYCWAEEFGLLKKSVSIYEKSLPEDRFYKISATKIKNGRWTWPYLLKNKHKPDPHTPTPYQLEAVHSKIFETKTTAVRDSLILSFYEDVGLRKSEVLSLTVDDIPSWDQIDKAKDINEGFILKITGKGDKIRHVLVPAELMERSREYIEEDRRAVEGKVRKKYSGYISKKALFIGETTGRELNSQYLSRRLSKIMAEAGIEGATPHRIRATYIETQVEARDGYDSSGHPLPAEQVLWKVGELVGHSSAQSTRPYLNKIRSKSYSSVNEQIIDKTFKLNDLNRKVLHKQSELRRIEGVTKIMQLIEHGDTSQAEELILNLLNVPSNKGD